MILATLLSARAWLTALPRGVKVALTTIAVIALLGAVWAIWLTIHDRNVITQHETARQATATTATVKSAEERANDAVQGIIAEQSREAAIAKAEASEAAKPVEQRAGLPPTTVALNCARLRGYYSAAELAKIAAYQEKCR